MNRNKHNFIIPTILLQQFRAILSLERRKQLHDRSKKPLSIMPIEWLQFIDK